jgi:hypothetical protein
LIAKLSATLSSTFRHHYISERFVFGITRSRSLLFTQPER